MGFLWSQREEPSTRCVTHACNYLAITHIPCDWFCFHVTFHVKVCWCEVIAKCMVMEVQFSSSSATSLHGCAFTNAVS